MSYKTKSELNGWRKNPQYPMLFLTKDGRTRLWACWVIGDTVYRTDGLIDGKLKDPQSHAYEGNTLRTGEEQAPLEAEKMWLKQVDHDYKPDTKDVKGLKIYNHVIDQKESNGGMNRGVKMFEETKICVGTTAGKKVFSEQHRPMLAQKYKDWVNEDTFTLTNPGKSIKFPAIVQAKVDGIRTLPRIMEDGVLLESRNGNGFVHLDHIRKEIKYWLEKKGHPEIILDGELYVHRLYRDSDGNPTLNWTRDEMAAVERYQFISEACKITRSKPHPFEEFVEFWVFDIWDLTKTNTERQKLLQNLFEDYDGDVIKLVPTKIIKSHDEIEEIMTEMVGETNDRQGFEFEGIMVRQAGAKYTASTTHQSCLLKYKRFEDEEWEICGAEKCVGGTQDGSIKWICVKTIGGKEKKVIAKQIGDAEKSKELYRKYTKNPKAYNGKMINIRFNDRTRDMVPRFPRAVAIVQDK